MVNVLDPPYENPIERPALSLNTSSAVSASYWTVMFDKSAAAMALPVFGSLIELSVALTAACTDAANRSPETKPPVDADPLTLTVNAAELFTPSSVN